MKYERVAECQRRGSLGGSQFLRASCRVSRHGCPECCSEGSSIGQRYSTSCPEDCCMSMQPSGGFAVAKLIAGWFPAWNRITTLNKGAYDSRRRVCYPSPNVLAGKSQRGRYAYSSSHRKRSSGTNNRRCRIDRPSRGHPDAGRPIQTYTGKFNLKACPLDRGPPHYLNTPTFERDHRLKH